MAKIWEAGPEKQSDRFVLLALADFANDDGECWPSMQRLASKTCMTERGAQKIVRRLEADGWLTIGTGGGRHGCNQYTINPEPRSPFQEVETPNEVHPERGSPPNVDAETLNESAENPEHGSPEPSRTIKEPSEEPPVGPPAEDEPPPKARLPEAWVLDDAGWDYARSLKLNDTEIQEIADDFHAYWTDRRDRDSRKSERGWRQCWKNRVRVVAPQFIRNRNLAFSAGAGRYGQGGGIAGVVARRRSAGQI